MQPRGAKATLVRCLDILATGFFALQKFHDISWEFGCMDEIVTYINIMRIVRELNSTAIRSQKIWKYDIETQWTEREIYIFSAYYPF